MPASREFCKAYRSLTGERANRHELARLGGELETAKLALANQQNQKAGEIVTQIAEDLAAQTGLSNRTVMLMLAIWMAILIELCSSQVLEMAYAAGHKPKVPQTETMPAETPETAIPQPLLPAKAADTLQDDAGMPAGPTLGQPKADAPDWVGMRLLGHRSASVSYQAAYDALSPKPKKPAALHRPARMRSAGRWKVHKYEAKRIGGERELMILGAVLKEQREIGSLEGGELTVKYRFGAIMVRLPHRGSGYE